MRRLALLAGLVALASAVVAAVAATPARPVGALARLPSVDNPGPRGVGVVAAWLAATGRPAAVLRPGDRGPGRADVWLLLGPTAPLPEADVRALLGHAEAGGLVVWAQGNGPQPALERALGTVRSRWTGGPTFTGLPGHPLLGGLELPAGGSGVGAAAAAARPLTGGAPPAAVSVPRGAGEILVLADAAPLDGGHAAALDALSLWVRLAARGRLVFDERWLAPPAPRPPRTAAALVGLQALLAAAALLLALAPRLGAVRPPPRAAGRRTARDYLEALAELSRRAGAGPALAAASWRRLRRRLEREAGVPARLADGEAALRLEARSAAAAEALRRGARALAAGGPAPLLGVGQAAADVEAGLRLGPGRFDSGQDRG